MKTFKQFLLEATQNATFRPGTKVKYWDNNWQTWVPATINVFRGDHYEVIDDDGRALSKVKPDKIRLASIVGDAPGS